MAVDLKIRVDSKEAAAAIKKFAQQSGAEVRKLERRTKRSAGAMTGAFKSLGFAIKSAFTVGFIASVGKSIKLASDFNEAANLARKTFGQFADQIFDFAKQGPQAIGESEGATLALTSEIGSLVKSFGFAEEEASKFSLAIAQTAADIGSLKNAKTEETLVAIRAALVGSSEPMLRFGADTREAALQQIALELGIKKTKGPLTTQERALAAINKIIRDNHDAMGDFADTSNEFATSSKITFAEFKTSLEGLGKVLLPAATDITNFLKILFQDGLSNIKTAIDKDIEEIKNKFDAALEKLSPREGAEKALRAATMGGNIALKEQKEAVDEVDLGFDNLGKAIDDLLDKFENLKKSKPVVDTEKVVGDLTENFVKAQRHADMLPTSLEGMLPPLELAGVKSARLLAIQTEVEATNFRLADEAAEYAKEMEVAADTAFVLASNLASAAVFGDNLEETIKNLGKELAFSLLATSLSGGQPVGLFGSLSKNLLGFQHGGRPPVGRASVVGERGPEIFVPDRPGTIIPNNQIVNNDQRATFNLSFPGVRQLDKFTLRTQVLPLLREIQQEGGFF